MLHIRGTITSYLAVYCFVLILSSFAQIFKYFAPFCPFLPFFRRIEHVPLLFRIDGGDVSYNFHLWCTFVKRSPSIFFFFFFIKILIFRVGVKGQKMSQNDKKKSLSRSISQEAYILWSWLLVLMCKTMTFPGAFFIFSKFWFFGLWGGKWQKWPKLTKGSVCLTLCCRNYTTLDCDFWYTCRVSHCGFVL